jgi:glucose/arabinose dehydrogenase
MKRFVKITAVVVALLVAAVTGLWMTVPLNVPWRSMLQQMRALPSWLDPPTMSPEDAGRLVVPTGYAVSLFATGVAEARGLRVTARGDVLVSSPRDGQVVLLEADRDDDGLTDGRRVLVDGLNGPTGLDLAGVFLYVGEEDAVGRIGFDSATGTVTGSYQRIIEGLPPGGNHWKKTVRVGPDGLLYVALGSSCNVCVEEDERRAALLRYTTTGAFVDVYATGLRNSGGFDWSPVSGALFATDNGRDMLGDDFPSCELNEIVEGGFYGWPFLNGSNVPDPDLGTDRPAALPAAVDPAHAFQPHNAPLGFQFLRHVDHPAEYRHAAVAALHGSWNRSSKDGYKVVSLHFATDGTVEERDFLTGFLRDETAVGRPADVAEGPDGSIYVSDDFGGAVYRVDPSGSSRAVIAAPPGSDGGGYDPGEVGTQERQGAIAAGRATMDAEGCVACHAPTETGGRAQVVLTDLASRYTLDALVDYLARPNPPMPPYEEDAAARRRLAIYLLDTY